MDTSRIEDSTMNVQITIEDGEMTDDEAYELEQKIVEVALEHAPHAAVSIGRESEGLVS
jgi:hypothetical protein